MIQRMDHVGIVVDDLAAAECVVWCSDRIRPAVYDPTLFIDREVAAYLDGEISAAELYRRTVARYRQP